jgi:hypothetical protein
MEEAEENHKNWTQIQGLSAHNWVWKVSDAVLFQMLPFL